VVGRLALPIYLLSLGLFDRLGGWTHIGTLQVHCAGDAAVGLSGGIAKDLATEEKRQLPRRINAAFTPAQPVQKRDLFSGRKKQFKDLVDIVIGPGQHGVVFGERGVGKTSLASIASQVFDSDTLRSVRVNCHAGDSYASIWQKVFQRIARLAPAREIGFSKTPLANGSPPPDIFGPDDVETALAELTSNGVGMAVFIDEFDRVRDPAARLLMADTIKGLADHAIDTTIVLIGVADDVSELVAEHSSIERGLVQVHMPRMSPAELEEIVTTGMQHVGIGIDHDAVTRIVLLSQGLPHYAHLVSREGARSAVAADGRVVTVKHVLDGLQGAIERSIQSLAESYHAAISNSRSKTLYPDLLLAAAVTPTDSLGYFGFADLREPLLKIVRGQRDVASLSRNLHHLCGDDRGAPLQKVGRPRHYRFRFKNPAMPPYVIMRALADQHFDFDLLDQFLAAPQSS
jgi:Cdc6-like AAA superfamily ATPase